MLEWLLTFNDMNKLNISILSIYYLLLLSSCTSFLDVKSDKSLSTPSTLKDLDALLQYSNVFTFDPITPEVSTTDFYCTDADWEALPDEDIKNAYQWASKYVIMETSGNDWKAIYDIVFYCNVVLDEITKIERTVVNAHEYDKIKGEALFFRGRAFLQAAFTWVEAYDADIAHESKGLPLRLDPDFNNITTRASMLETYRQILDDLHEASKLLPISTFHITRPSKPAAYGTLSRAYLAMRIYDKAYDFADSTLVYTNKLLDYNFVDELLDRPIPVENDEVIFNSVIRERRILGVNRLNVAPELIEMYDSGDLRKNVYFSLRENGTHGFKARFGGHETEALFSGITTSEVLLNRAECHARAGRFDEAKVDLERLMRNRYMDGNIPEIQDSDMLQNILRERRKELLFRGVRWMDIKRLNKEYFDIYMYRTVKGEKLELVPNDKRYARPLPEYVVSMAGLEQN